MENIPNREPIGADTIEPEAFDASAIPEDAPGCTGIESIIPDRKHSPDVILNNQLQLTGLLSPEGRFLAVNEAARAFAGVEESELIGEWFWSRLKDAIEKAAGGIAVRYETTKRVKNGTIRSIDFCLSPVFDGNCNVMYLVPESLDITDAVLMFRLF